MTGESTVYFLGAGASADAGVPLTVHLLSKIARRIRRKRDRSALRKFIKTFGSEVITGSVRPPIVDVISLVDSCLRTNRPLDRSFTVEQLRVVRDQLTLELSQVVEAPKGRGAKVQMTSDALEQPGAKDRRIARYYRSFARSLQPRNRDIGERLQPGDAVITTNYDTNIDVALYELAYWEDSGGNPRYSKVSDVYLGSDFRDPYHDENALSVPKATIDLFKLHGSLNWLYCPMCSRLYVAAFGYSVRYIEMPDKSERTCHCNYYSLEPLIVAPSAYQEIVNPHLHAIWMNAYHALENADRWVFVGYSLPAEDIAVRSLLYRAMSGRCNTGDRPHVEVVCLNRDVKNHRSRYEGLLGKPIQFRPTRFLDYVSRLQPV